MRFPDRLSATLWSCRAIVWMASWLVPASGRSAWRSTQYSRFWHWCHFLAESGQLNAQNRLLLARTSWHLFPEALWTRHDRDQFYASGRRLMGSPVALLAALMLAGALLVFGSGAVGVVREFYSTPVPQPDRVVVITLDGKGINGTFARTRSDTLLDLASIWNKSNMASGLTPFSWGPGTILLPSRDLSVATARVGANFFTTVGVRPLLGRSFQPDDVEHCRECVLLSYGIWEREFHADPNIAGKQVVLNGSPRKIIGVLPRGLRLISPAIFPSVRT